MPDLFQISNPRSIDLILYNGKSSFNAMIVTVLKGDFFKRGRKIVTYRGYSKFSAVDFKDNLVHIVSSELSEVEDYGVLRLGSWAY